MTGLGILCPVLHTGSRVDANHPIRPRTKFAKFRSNAACLANLLHKFLAVFIAAHRRFRHALEAKPAQRQNQWRNLSANLIRQLLNAVIVGIDTGMRIKQKEIHAVEGMRRLPPCSQVEHRVEVNAWFSARTALPTRPGHMALCNLGNMLWLCSLMDALIG